jgi:hypothetical protein
VFDKYKPKSIFFRFDSKKHIRSTYGVSCSATMSLTLDHPFGDFHPVCWMISGWLILADLL